MTPSIRPALDSDVAFCESLSRSNMALYHAAHGVEWNTERFIAGWPHFENFMLEVDGAIVGLVRLLVVDDALEIRDLQLLAAHRGCGTGTWAIGWAKAEAARRGLDTLRLRVFRENPALRLYQRLGFRTDSIDATGKVHMSYAFACGATDSTGELR